MRWFVVTSLVLFMVACSEAPAEAENTDEARPVKLLTVTENNGAKLREFPGVVEAAKVAQLTFRVAGEITELPVRPGAEVKQGDLIARLDPTDYQLAVDQAKAQYELAASQYERNKVLVNEGVMSEAQFDQVKSQRAVAKSNYETAKANLEYTELRAPFDGVIASLAVEAYENIQPKQPIVTLQINNAIDVSIQVPEKLFARVKKQTDYEPMIRFDAAPEFQFRAHLKEWDSQADPATNTYEVVFTLPKPDNLNVLPGMTATVIVDMAQVLRSTITGMLVPTKAVFTNGSNTEQPTSYVWVVAEDMSVEKRKVVVGTATNDGLTIVSGLKEGETIVIAGVYQLREGQKVREWQRERGL